MKSTPRVTLVSMPWASLTEPSLGLGILDAILTEEGICTQTRYFNLHLLEYLRPDTYRMVADVYAANDFLFTSNLQSNISKLQLDTLKQIAKELLASDRGWIQRFSSEADIVDLFQNIRTNVIPKYIESCATQILADEPTMVGMTCLYDQTMASISLAQELKKRQPSLFIVLGGYALHGEVGDQVERVFSCIDRVIEGPGERKIIKLALESVQPFSTISIFETKSTFEVQKAKSKELPSYPLPKFESFFNELQWMEEYKQIRINASALPIEASRGCWWGQLHHCVFCGIDDETMKYTSRKYEAVYKELNLQKDKYGVQVFRFVDYILPHQYYETLLPKLAGSELYLRCEIKSNVKRHHMERISDAGFVEVQPGIESFSTDVLRIMKKGVTALQNVICLMLGYEFGVKIQYNIIYGFPSESKQSYLEMLKTIPLLYHLDPPDSCMEVLTTRFSPLRDKVAAFNIEKREHDFRYNVMFSDDFLKDNDFSLSKYCYYFERGYEFDEGLESLHRMIDIQVDHWKERHTKERPILNWCATSEGIDFTDTRFKPEGELIQFGVVHLQIYQACDKKIRNLTKLVAASCPNKRNSLQDAIDDLIRARVVLVENNKVIGLACNKMDRSN